MHSSALLAPALERCWASAQEQGHKPYRIDWSAARQRPPLHLIIRAPSALRTFAGSPAAATLVVDAFVSSRRKHKRVLLSILGTDGNAVTMQRPGSCLHERSALQELSLQLASKQLADVKRLLLEGQHLLGHSAGQLRVLHADESMLPLMPPVSAPSEEDAGPSAVAVIFAGADEAARIRAACVALGVLMYERAAAGGISTGPAYVGMLHSEGLLAPAIRTPVQHSLLLSPLACVSSRRAAHAPSRRQRHRGGRRHNTHRWVEKMKRLEHYGTHALTSLDEDSEEVPDGAEPTRELAAAHQDSEDSLESTRAGTRQQEKPGTSRPALVQRNVEGREEVVPELQLVHAAFDSAILVSAY